MSGNRLIRMLFLAAALQVTQLGDWVFDRLATVIMASGERAVDKSVLRSSLHGTVVDAFGKHENVSNVILHRVVLVRPPPRGRAERGGGCGGGGARHVLLIAARLCCAGHCIWGAWLPHCERRAV